MNTKWLSLRDAERISAAPEIYLAAGKIPKAKVALISCMSPDPVADDIELNGYWYQVLKLQFHDERKGSFLLGRKSYPTFTETHANQILDFIDRVKSQVDEIWVHCEAGRSRSPAIAKYIAYAFDFDVKIPPTYNDHVYEVLMKAALERQK